MGLHTSQHPPIGRSPRQAFGGTPQGP